MEHLVCSAHYAYYAAIVCDAVEAFGSMHYIAYYVEDNQESMQYAMHTMQKTTNQARV